MSTPVFESDQLGLAMPQGETGFTQMSGAGPSIEAGSVAARTLESIFTGCPITLVNSPPGAGKSTLIAQVVAFILAHSDLSVHVVAPTNHAALEIAGRIAGQTPPGSVLAHRVSGRLLPEGVGAISDGYVCGADGRPVAAERQVQVTTLHRVRTASPQVDLMIVEEAYQVPYGLLAEAADGAEQILAVGDPGQIGPVVTHDISPWRGMSDAPAARAPEALAGMGAKILTLPATYRIGPVTTGAIAPLYGFEFVSKRPDRHVAGTGEVGALGLPAGASARELAPLLVGRVRELLGRDYATGDGTRPVTQADICVIAARNDLVAETSALLAASGMERVRVGTADSLQGGQWPVVIAADPLAGRGAPSEHALDPGRLCVMTSRAMAHLTWAYAPDWASRIDRAERISEASRVKNRKVRTALIESSRGEERR